MLCRHWRRFLCVALTAFVCGSVGVLVAAETVTAAASRSSRARCHHGQVALRLATGKRRARTACIALGGRGSSRDAWGTATLFSQVASGTRLRGVHRLPSWAVGRRANADGARAISALATLSNPLGTHARAAIVTPFADEKPFSTPDGWHGVAKESGNTFEPDQGAPGDAGAQSDKEVTARDGDATMSVPEHERIAIATCPTAAGDVAGTYDWSQSKTVSGPLQGGSLSETQRVQIKAKILGHTTDDGKLRDFDLDMVYQAYSQVVQRDARGHIVQSSAPELWTIHLSRHGLHIDSPFDEVFSGGVEVSSVVGPGGSWTRSIPKANLDIAQDSVRKLALAALRSGELFRTLQGAWQDGACIDVNFSSTDLSVSPHLGFDGKPNGGQVGTMKPGQAARLTATVTAVHGGKLAAGRYTTALHRSGSGDTGTLAPTAGTFSGGPLQFTYTAPTQNWTKHDDTVSVDVTVTSHQGRGLGVLYLTPKNETYSLRYTHSSQLDYDGRPEQVAAAPAQGTEDRHEKWSLASEIPLTGNPTTGLSGTAPLTYTNALYHLKWQGTFTGQASCNGTDTIDLTSTTAGTAEVRSLTFSSPGSASLQFDVGEPQGSSEGLPPASTENYSDALSLDSPCHSADNSYTFHQWNSDYNYFYEQAGTDRAGVVTIDSGWQPGTGDVVATRTVTGSYPWIPAPDPAQTSTWTDTYEIVQTPGS